MIHFFKTLDTSGPYIISLQLHINNIAFCLGEKEKERPVSLSQCREISSLLLPPKNQGLYYEINYKLVPKDHVADLTVGLSLQLSQFIKEMAPPYKTIAYTKMMVVNVSGLNCHWSPSPSFCKSVKDNRVQLGMYLLVQPGLWQIYKYIY